MIQTVVKYAGIHEKYKHTELVQHKNIISISCTVIRYYTTSNYVQLTVNFESYLNVRNILTKEVKCVHLSFILMLP